MIGFIDAAFAYVTPYTGLSKDQVKLVTILYTAVPLCGILKRLPDNKPHYKNLFNIAYQIPNKRADRSVSLFILVGVYDLWNGLWILLGNALGTYFIAFQLRGPMMPWIAFIFVMGIMSLSHIIRQVYATPLEIVDY